MFLRLVCRHTMPNALVVQVAERGVLAPTPTLEEFLKKMQKQLEEEKKILDERRLVVKKCESNPDL